MKINIKPARHGKKWQTFSLCKQLKIIFRELLLHPLNFGVNKRQTVCIYGEKGNNNTQNMGR